MAATPEDIVRAFVKENKLQQLGNAKSLGAPELFYSPFYKKLYEKETQQIALELMFSAENILTNFDYTSIDSVPDTNPSIAYDTDGQIIYIKPNPSLYIANASKTPMLMNDSYLIYDAGISPALEKLDTKYGYTYNSVLSNFGYFKESSQEITPNLPKYDANGNPAYDLQIEFLDLSTVSSYEVSIEIVEDVV
jgi:hypothetical protein